MIRLALMTGMAVLLAVALNSSVSAQEGCRQTASSCSALFKNCEQNCNKVGSNPSACVARVCSQPLEGCKSNGVWRSVQSGSACWATKNRS